MRIRGRDAGVRESARARQWRNAVFSLLAAVLVCDELAEHSRVAAVPVLTSSFKGVRENVVAGEVGKHSAEAQRNDAEAAHVPSWDTTRPQGAAPNPVEDNFSAHDLGASADGADEGAGRHEEEGGYGHSEEDDYGYAEIGHFDEFDHARLLDPEHGLAEEWENFMRFDNNSDAGVDLAEWLHRLLPPSIHEPDPLQKIHWTREFEDADKDKDGQLSWEDWKAMLFHELPQAPAWIDGHDADGVPRPTEDRLLSAFDLGDKDNNGQLTVEELAGVLLHAPGTDHSEDATRDDMSFRDLAGGVLADLDADGSGTVSVKEFLAFGKPEEGDEGGEREGGGHGDGAVYGREVELPF